MKGDMIMKDKIEIYKKGKEDWIKGQFTIKNPSAVGRQCGKTRLGLALTTGQKGKMIKVRI